LELKMDSNAKPLTATADAMYSGLPASATPASRKIKKV
jgi:hypothetical protein